MTQTLEPVSPVDYSDLSADEQNLYIEITEMFGEKWTHEQTLDFMGELDHYSITTSDNLCDAFIYVTDCQYTEDGAKAEFAEYWYCETMDSEPGAYDNVVVDWAATYDYALRFDTFIIEFDGDFYFFSSNY